jgi:hypothetical protein
VLAGEERHWGQKSTGPGHTQLVQDVFHQTPIREGRLQQIDAYKGGEEVPVGAVEIAQQQRQQDKAAGDGADIVFHGHGDPSE